MQKWVLIFLIFSITPVKAAEVKVVKSSEGWRLLVEGKPFLVKGVCYLPAKIGESAYENTLRDWMIVDEDKDGRNDVAYQSWLDENRNNKKDAGERIVGDFQLLKEMGCNAIRIYHHPSSKFKLKKLHHENITLSHAPNKKLLRELHEKYGIWVVMGDLLGAYGVGSGASSDEETDYLSPEHKRNMIISVKNMILEFKDEPYLLMWALGNENNYQHLTRNNCEQHPEAFSRFVSKIVRMIHELDSHHPVCLINGGTQFLDLYARYASEIDIFGLNEYPKSPDFGNLWHDVAEKYDKPVLLTEFGDGQPKIVDGLLNEEIQAQIYRNLWVDIIKHTAGQTPPGNAIGGFVFEWLDNWWQDGDSALHNFETDDSLEWRGICAQGDGTKSPLLRQQRKAYFYLKDIWTTRATSARQ